MDATALRAMQAPLKDRYKSDPKSAYITLKAKGSLDDTSIAFICDPAHREYVRSWGEDPEQLLVFYAKIINAVLDEVPDDVTITLHQCRGNRASPGARPGGLARILPAR